MPLSDYAQPSNALASYSPPQSGLASVVPPPSNLTGAGSYDSQGAAAAAGATSESTIPGIQPPPALARLPGGPAKPSFQPTTRSTKQTSKEGPFSQLSTDATLEALKSGKELAGATLEGEAAQGAASKEQEYLQSQYEASLAGATAARQADQAKQLGDYHQRMVDLQRAASDAKIDEDPADQYMRKLGVGGRLVQALQMAVMGLSFGYSGRGINPGQWLDTKIKAYTQAQVENIRNKREGARDAHEAYEDLRQKFGDDERAHMALEVAQRQWVISQLKQRASDQMAPQMSRLRAAQIGNDLAQTNLKTIEHLDDRTISTIEKSGAEKYIPASAGGPGKVGVRVTLDDGTRAVIPAEQAKELNLVPKSAIEQRGEQADIRKKEAEATKAEQGTQPDPTMGAIAKRGQKLESTAFLHDPIAYVARNFQGTDSSKQELARQSIESGMMGIMHKKFGARTPEAQERLAGPFIPDKGDRPDRIAEKIKNFNEFIAGLPDLQGDAVEKSGAESE